jgi:hypothetical protein
MSRLAAAFDAPNAKVENIEPDRKSANGKRAIGATEEMLIAVNLPKIYGKKIAMLAIEDETTKKEIVRKALDMYLKQRGMI